MARIQRIPVSRFPKRAKGTPGVHFSRPGTDRGLGTGNNRHTRTNNWRPGLKSTDFIGRG